MALPFFLSFNNKTIMETLKLTIENHIAHVIINRPEKANALNQTAWEEIARVTYSYSHLCMLRVLSSLWLTLVFIVVANQRGQS